MKGIGKIFVLAAICALFTLLAIAQSSEAPYTPLNDLGSDLYQGKQGGLYPQGSNMIPASHLQGFSAQVALIKPLDGNGNPSNSGKIGFALVGASSPKIEFPYIEEQARLLPNLNPQVEFINIGQGGLTYEKLLDASARYWNNNVPAALQAQNLTNKQVQVVWLKSDSLRRDDPLTFPATPEYQKGLIKQIVQKIKTTFPNCRVVYFTARNTTIYVPNDNQVEKHSEPRGYFNGWGIKWAIEDQINGDPALNYNGDNAQAPIMVWGFYFWSKGATPRVTDGYNWLQTDTRDQGVHPSEQGARKVAERFVNNFATDPVTAQWFLVGAMPPSNCAEPSWIINGKNKIDKVQRLIDERDNVRALFKDLNGNLVKELFDIFHSCNDLNMVVGRGEFVVTFFDKNGQQIQLNQDVSYTVKLK